MLFFADAEPVTHRLFSESSRNCQHCRYCCKTLPLHHMAFRQISLKAKSPPWVKQFLLKCEELFEWSVRVCQRPQSLQRICAKGLKFVSAPETRHQNRQLLEEMSLWQYSQRWMLGFFGELKEHASQAGYRGAFLVSHKLSSPLSPFARLWGPMTHPFPTGTRTLTHTPQGS